MTSKIFNDRGRFLGYVEQPRLLSGTNRQERVDNLEPVAKSHDSSYFLLARKERNKQTYEGAISKLVKNKSTGRYEFSDIESLFSLGRLNGQWFQLNKDGELSSVKFSYGESIIKQPKYGTNPTQTIKSAIRGCYVVKNDNWVQYKIELPRLQIGDPEDENFYEEDEPDIHVDLTDNFIVFIRRNAGIFKVRYENLPQDEMDTINEKAVR